MKKKSNGRFILREVKLHWYCITCMQKGVAGISVHSKQPMDSPPLADIQEIIKTVCHNNNKCYEPDIRLVQ